MARHRWNGGAWSRPLARRDQRLSSATPRQPTAGKANRRRAPGTRRQLSTSTAAVRPPPTPLICPVPRKLGLPARTFRFRICLVGLIARHGVGLHGAAFAERLWPALRRVGDRLLF